MAVLARALLHVSSGRGPGHPALVSLLEQGLGQAAFRDPSPPHHSVIQGCRNACIHPLAPWPFRCSHGSSSMASIFLPTYGESPGSPSPYPSPNYIPTQAVFEQTHLDFPPGTPASVLKCRIRIRLKSKLVLNPSLTLQFCSDSKRPCG